MSLDSDRALVRAMCAAGEPMEVVEDLLVCLDLSDAERDDLRQTAREAHMTSGDVIGMNPLTSQPQRSKPR